MRLTSLEAVRQGAAHALRRFPFPLLFAWAACATFDVAILTHGGRSTTIAMLLALGIPLTFAATLRSERSQSPSFATRWLPFLAIAALLAVLILIWPKWSDPIQVRRYVQLSLCAHAWVAFWPYVGVAEPHGFWQYNRRLLERFILASIFAAVLVAGIFGALASLRPLFGIHVSDKAFGLVATWVWFLFHPWFFLAGVPGDLRALEESRDYPGTIKIFAQFILVPLVAIYQALLTSYLVKVVITGQWPSGIIGRLVSAEAVAGILALLLVHPVREQAENLWVRTFSRVFYLALLPSIVMLGLAIAKRVGQYGVTEDRYFVIALTVWLGAISLYFITRRDGDIRWIPISLAAVAVFTFGGPWGAYAVARSSQHGRLVHLLVANGMWKDGRLVPPARELSLEARRDLSSVLEYLLEFHDPAGLRPELGAALAAADTTLAHGSTKAERVAKQLGFVYVNRWEQRQPTPGTFTWERPYNETEKALPVAPYDYHARIEGPDFPFEVGSDAFRLLGDFKQHRFVLVRARQRPRDAVMDSVDTLATASIDSLIAASRVQRFAGAPLPHVAFAGPGARATLYVTRLQGNDDPIFNVYGLSGDLYFSLAASDSAARPDTRRDPKSP